MLVSITQAAKELGVSLNHIRAKIRSKEWPAYQLGTKAIRVDVEEIKRNARLEKFARTPTDTSRKKT